MPYTATHKYASISPRKVRHLANLVRGKFADEALDILKFQPHRGARMLEKVIENCAWQRGAQAGGRSGRSRGR